MDITLDEVIAIIGVLREIEAEKEWKTNEPEYQLRVAACDTAIKILAQLAAAGFRSREDALDLISDYNGLGRDYRALRQRFQVAQRPKLKEGIHRCPRCGYRVKINFSYCPRCGGALSWEGNGIE